MSNHAVASRFRKYSIGHSRGGSENARYAHSQCLFSIRANIAEGQVGVGQRPIALISVGSNHDKCIWHTQ